jgi:hypothetical protein
MSARADSVAPLQMIFINGNPVVTAGEAKFRSDM